MGDDIGRQQLTSLFINNSELQDIERHLGRFNPFSVLNVEKYEIRHSSMLAWLLDPSETHGFGDKFLKAVMSETFRDRDSPGAPSALDIHLADLSQAQVFREKQNIDLLIECPVNRWFFVVENKFYSKQSTDQLKRYRKRIEERVAKENLQYKTGYIFLTLNEEDPDDESYAPLSYECVSKLLKEQQVLHRDVQSSDVTPFINQYIALLEDETGMSQDSKDIKQVAKSLYREHRRVIDFIVEHGQNTDFGFAAEAITGGVERWEPYKVEGEQFIHGSIGKSYVSFLPLSWYNALGKDREDYPGCENYGMGYPVSCWIELKENSTDNEGQLWLHAQVGPVQDRSKRSELVNAIMECKNEQVDLRLGFRQDAANPNTSYSRFFKGNKRYVADVTDTDQLAKEIQDLLLLFKPEFDAVAKVLPIIGDYGLK